VHAEFCKAQEGHVREEGANFSRFSVSAGIWMRHSNNGCAIAQVVGALMHEIECILHEYLSFNWDRVEDVFEANSFYLEESGLKCLWKSKSNLQVSLPLLAMAPALSCQGSA
jgi:hypothetical protein